MSGSPVTRAACATVMMAGFLLAGCATTQSTDFARNRAKCPMGTMMYCDDKRRRISSHHLDCACVSHSTINDILDDL